MEHNSQLRKLGLFDARVPRYTSYPPSPHFTDAVGPDQVRDWQRALPAGEALSLYVHVPFCKRLCWFCACRTQGAQSMAPVEAYIRSVLTEIEMLKGNLPEGMTISRIHLGGGTPTLLPPVMLKQLADALKSIAPLRPDFEFSVEIDPAEIDDARLDALAEAGLNRASVGVQDFDPDIQATIGRIQGFDLTKSAIDALRARGVGSVNLDVLYGLPHQTEQRIVTSMQKVLSLEPDRIALYGYAHVPWMSTRQRMIPADALPDAPTRLRLFETAQKLSLWDGYTEIGIDHFARPEDSLTRASKTGTLRRNFQGYTDDPAETLIGLGASSISQYRQGYAQNAPRTADYHDAIRNGRFSTAKGHAFSTDDRLRAALIMEVLCTFTLSPLHHAQRLGISADRAKALVADLPNQFPGMIARQGDGLVLTKAGHPMARVIARTMDAYTKAENRHSSAI